MEWKLLVEFFVYYLLRSTSSEQPVQPTHPACLSAPRSDERSNNPTSLLIMRYCVTSNRMPESILVVIGRYGKILGTMPRPMRKRAPSIVEIVSSKPAIRQEETFPFPNTLTA